MHPVDLHCLKLRENAVVDSKQNLENTTLRRGVAGIDKVLRGLPIEDFARRVQTTAGLALVAECLQRPAPNGMGVRVFKLRPPTDPRRSGYGGSA